MLQALDKDTSFIEKAAVVGLLAARILQQAASFKLLKNGNCCRILHANPLLDGCWHKGAAQSREID